MKRIIICLAGILSLSAADVCLAAPPLQEGMWETTMETTMEGLPFAIPPTVVKTKQCLTKKDMIPRDENQKDCTIKKQKISGNKATWEFECNQDGSKMTGKGEVTYTGTSSSGTSTTNIVSEGQKMTATTRFKGKRLGPCTGEKDSMEINGQDVDKMKEEVMEVKQKYDAQMEAAKQKSTALIEKIRIPEEKPDACEHKGMKASMTSITEASPALEMASDMMKRKTECDERLGPLAIKAGEWEITTETTTKMTLSAEKKAEPKPKKRAKAKTKEKEKVKQEEQVIYGDVTSETKKACLSPDVEPMVGEEMKRSGNSVTWKSTANNNSGNITIEQESSGGVEYRGNSFEGGEISHYQNTTSYTRITGKRLGDGNCVSKGRESSSKPLTESTGNVIDNSTRKLKSFFGF